MSTAFARASRLASSAPKEFDFQFFIYQEEAKYPFWWSGKRLIQWFKCLPDNTLWNCLVCFAALLCVILVAMGLPREPNWVDVPYNILYSVHVMGLLYREYLQLAGFEGIWWKIFGFAVDILTYVHYLSLLFPQDYKSFFWDVKLLCYYLRLHRPFRYLWSLNDYNLKGSVVGTALKYFYIFLFLRVTCALFWLEIDKLEPKQELTALTGHAMYTAWEAMPLNHPNKTQAGSQGALFFNAVYIINRMFIPIGPSVAPQNDYERLMCLLVMITGCLVVAGAAVASLSLVISIYMRPEEAFRARFKLIMKEMQNTHVLPELQFKVETFYKMYWHKQRAVSVTHLLPIFPHTLPTAIYTDIYFEAQQKSRILRDLPYQFLWELSKSMTTTNYIPGDAVIQRSARKSSIIYITYGDVEMLTAEDDITPILRFTRGTVLSSCGGCASVACAKAHVEIRAATFCTAHVLTAKDLWKVALKYGKNNGQNFILRTSFEEHFEKVKKHYSTRLPENVKHKSSILHFKRNLMALKEAKDANGNLLLARTDIFLEVAGSYIMRNRADSSLSDEADAICLRPTFPCILQPTSSLQVVWNALVACIILAVCFTHPYYLVYKKTVPLEFRFYDYVVTGIFVLDLIVHLSTGANVEEGVPITFAQTSSQQMKSHWFCLDVLGTVPIFEFIGEGHFAGINKLLRLPKLFRVLKAMEDVCVYHSNVLRFLSYSVLLLIACYLLGALQQGVMCYRYDHCQVRNFTKSPFWSKEPLDDDNVESRLMFSLYWATSVITFTALKEPASFTSNRDVIPLLYMMIVLEMCVLLYIFIEAVYSATIMVTATLRDDYDSSIETVKHFLIRNNIDPMLRHRFITYLQLCWYTDKAYSMTHTRSSIFYDLPPHVYQDLVARQRIRYLLCIPFMKYIHREDLKTIASRARLFYTSPNEILLNTGDISNELYVIKQGICEILNPETKEVINSITGKNHFGVLECLLRFPAFYTVRAVTHVQVFSISRKYLIKAIDLPKLKDAINYTKKRPEYSYLQFRREAFLFYEPPPSPPNREYFKLPRKHEPDSDFLQPFYRLGFLAVLRYIFPRFTIRPDGLYLTRYEWFRAVCALSSAMVFPSYTYLQLQWPGLYFIALFLDVSAYYDILQRMLIGYFNEQGILVYHPSSTAAHYIKGAFIVDVLGCVPLENLEKNESLDGRDRIPSTTQYLMLNRLLQLYRLPSAMAILHQYIERRDIILVIKAIPIFMALINVLSCVMVYCTVDIFKPTVGSAGWQIIPLNDSGGSWITQFGNAFRFNMTESPWNLHLALCFWAVYETTTTGFNVFNPSNLELMQVLFWGMVIGAMISTYFSVRIISIRANVNKALASFQEHMKDIAAYMRKEKLSKDLQREVLAHYEYSWDKMGGTDYRRVLKLCDQITLRTDAILHIYGQTFAKCPILYHCDLSLLRIIGRAVRSNYFRKNTVIINTDNVIEDMYFVDYGCIEISVIQDSITSIVNLHRGSVFGNLDTAPTVRSPTTIVATNDVHLLQINSETFYKIIMDFPTVKVLMKKFRPHGENYITGSLHHAGSTESLRTWKERTFSSTLMMVSRRGLVKHLYIHNKASQMYLIGVSVLCMYGDVYNAGFQDNRIGLILALYLLDMGFYLKILMNYMLPFIVDGAQIRLSLIGVRTAYYHSEFKYDIASCIPIEILCLLRQDYIWWYFSVLRLNRMFRVVTVYNCIKRHHEKLNINLVLSTVSSVFIWFTLFIHSASCLWYYIGVSEDLIVPKSSWLHNDNGPSCDNHYVGSLYFILTTFTQNGVGDIMPKKQSEVIFVIILQLLSTMVFMVYVGEFSNIIQYQSFRSFGYYCKYLELQEFLKNNRVARNLVTVVNKYSLHLWRESRGVQVPHFLMKAPQCLKLKVMSAAYLHHFTKTSSFVAGGSLLEIFSTLCPGTITAVGVTNSGAAGDYMYVVKECEITDAMYLIHKGTVHELDEDFEQAVGIYKEGDCFGITQGLVRDSAYPYSYLTTTKAQVLTLRLKDWEYLLKHFPESNDVISKSEYRQSPDDRMRSREIERETEHKQSLVQDPDKGDKKRVHIRSKDITEINPMKTRSTPESESQNMPIELVKSEEYLGLRKLKEGNEITTGTEIKEEIKVVKNEKEAIKLKGYEEATETRGEKEKNKGKGGKDTMETKGEKEGIETEEYKEVKESKGDEKEIENKENNKTMEAKDETKGKEKVPLKDKKNENAKFKLPPGPSTLDIGPPIAVEPERWPMDSRRRSTVVNVDRQVQAELDRYLSSTNLPSKEIENSERKLSITSYDSNEDDKSVSIDTKYENKISGSTKPDKLFSSTSSEGRSIAITDTEEALEKGSKFIRKMSLAAKSLISRKASTSNEKHDGAEGEEKDTLLIEEGEQATQELIERYEEEELKRSLLSLQNFKTSNINDDHPKKKLKIKGSLDITNESIQSLDLIPDETTISIEEYMLESLGKNKEKVEEIDSDKDIMPEVRSKRHSNASQMSSRSKRSFRVRYMDEQHSSVPSLKFLASHQIPLLQTCRLSDNWPDSELTAEERSHMMMDSDVVNTQTDSSQPRTSDIADDDSSATLVPSKSSLPRRE